MAKKIETPKPLVGLTVNIYQNPESRSGFEGAAKVKKVLGWNPETGIARVRVKFRQTVGAVERTLFLAR